MLWKRLNSSLIRLFLIAGGMRSSALNRNDELSIGTAGEREISKEGNVFFALPHWVCPNCRNQKKISIRGREIVRNQKGLISIYTWKVTNIITAHHPKLIVGFSPTL